MAKSKVLLAEDDVTMVSLLKTLLKMEGFDVVALQADADVLAAARIENPDVLLLDLHLANQSVHFFAWLCTDGHPVLNSLKIQLNASRLVMDHRIVEANFFDRLPVALNAGVHNTDTEERTVLASHFLHANSNSHCNS